MNRNCRYALPARQAELLGGRRGKIHQPPFGSLPRSSTFTSADLPVSKFVTFAVLPSGSELLATTSALALRGLPLAMGLPTRFFE